MSKINNIFKFFLLFYLIFALPLIKAALDNNSNNNSINNNIETNTEDNNNKERVINKIVIHGNTLIPKDALLAKIPYREGQIFDPNLTSQLIKNLYQLNYFDDIEVKAEDIGEDKINLIINVKELQKLESTEFKGNYQLSDEDIESKLKLSEIPAINQEEANVIAQKIKNLYQEKNYHNVTITPELKKTENNNINLVFNIDEGQQAVVKQVEFEGVNAFPTKRLRNIIFTREDWLLSALDKSGTYSPEFLERDKFFIETYYQNQGYLAAKVVDTKVETDTETQRIKITFKVDEGDLYTIRCVSAPGNEFLTEEQLLAGIPIKPGQLYDKEKIRQTLDILRITWGQFGHIYADIEPQIKPDYENKTVDIAFISDLGSQVFLNRINILGNFKTRDYVIRRAIILNEGELLTNKAMDISKERIESLGFFEPENGVMWKINRVTENVADLDLILKETNTGSLFAQIGYGGADIKSPAQSLKVTAGISDRNWMGTGLRYNLNLTFSKEDRGAFFSIYQPWLFDRPIGGGFDAYVRRSTYEDFRNVTDIPVENVVGAVGQLSFTPQRFPNVANVLNSGTERIRYENPVRASLPGASDEEKELFQSIIDLRFQNGNLNWIGFLTGEDLRNHPVFPSRGYSWNLTGKFGVPYFGGQFGFCKMDFDALWLTPLIGECDLIFLLHGHMGWVTPVGNKVIPYRELYHIGGPATVRGFNYGQIGPQIFGDSIGAQKAFWVNAELIFNITQDKSVRTVLFYDGGAGWDTANQSAFAKFRPGILTNNRFNYRHAIGFGIRLTQPTPLRVDWAFKLDRNKRLNESPFEVHFSMTRDF